MFRRSKKTDRTAPYVVDTHPAPGFASEQKHGEDDDEKLVKLMRSESDPELSAARGAGPAEEGYDKESRKRQKKQKGKSSDRKTKALSTAFEHISPGRYHRNS